MVIGHAELLFLRLLCLGGCSFQSPRKHACMHVETEGQAEQRRQCKRIDAAQPFDGLPVLTVSSALIAAINRFSGAASSIAIAARSSSLFFTRTPLFWHFSFSAAIFAYSDFGIVKLSRTTFSFFTRFGLASVFGGAFTAFCFASASTAGVCFGAVAEVFLAAVFLAVFTDAACATGFLLALSLFEVSGAVAGLASAVVPSTASTFAFACVLPPALFGKWKAFLVGALVCSVLIRSLLFVWRKQYIRFKPAVLSEASSSARQTIGSGELDVLTAVVAWHRVHHRRHAHVSLIA
ncbi:hypothetical protein [Caballeronia sp. LZ065]|uniref:hypothetical protein n=1 Tax=Caballeronia sp. LZ065 TaxID=3038571 RepID=UPI00286CF38D|nr:hypothetical protein [Caballeronia sp. LZ065]